MFKLAHQFAGVKLQNDDGAKRTAMKWPMGGCKGAAAARLKRRPEEQRRFCLGKMSARRLYVMGDVTL
jgi:hypothetical protein